MKTATLALAFLALSSFSAQAADSESHFACGANHQKGPEEAEVGLVYGADGNHLYLAGAEQKAENVSVTNKGQIWYVNLELKNGDQRAFEIHEKTSDMQEYLEPSEGDEKAVGKAKPCTLKMQAE